MWFKLYKDCFIHHNIPSEDKYDKLAARYSCLVKYETNELGITKAQKV